MNLLCTVISRTVVDCLTFLGIGVVAVAIVVAFIAAARWLNDWMSID